MDRYASDALKLFSDLIRIRRIKGNIAKEEFAVRVGITIEILEQIEQADPSCPIGCYFAAAEGLKIHLFEDEQTKLAWRLFDIQEKLALLPSVENQMGEPFEDKF